ncbi:MAG: DUF6868 family protein [Casimicrobiaceae bacterium]
MTMESLQALLGWCAVLNYAVLLAWFLAFWVAREPLRALHGPWFRLTDTHFDLAHYAAMAVYKVGILLLNIIPYAALRIVVP